MYKWVRMSRRLLRVFYLFCYIILLVDIALAMFEQPRMEAKWFAFIFSILLFSNIIREHCSRAIILFLIHIAIGVAVFFIVKPIVYKIFILIMVVEFFFDGYYYMARGYNLKRLFDVPWGIVTLGIASSLLGEYFKMNDLKLLGIVVPLITITLFLISLYLESLDDYLVSTREVSGVPIKQLLSINSVIISGVLCVAFAILGLAYLLHFQVVLEKFFKAVLTILKVIVVIFLAIIDFAVRILGGNAQQRPAPKIQEQLEEGNVFGDIVVFILYLGLIILAVIVVIKVFSMIIRALMARQDRKFEFVETLSADNKKKVIREKIKKEDSLRGNSPVIRARRIYKKHVKSFKKFFTPDKYVTTADIKEMMEKAAPEKAGGNITELYNGVRYGTVIPDREYLNSMKSQK